MLLKYKKRSNVAAAIWLGTVIGLIVVSQPSVESTALAGGGALALYLAYAGSSLYAGWAYAKAKGYPGWYGPGLTCLSVIGLIILAVLKDKHKTTPGTSSNDPVTVY
jgi:peptidoglycan/LPS O-acetylase OafA/YrhL